MATIQPYLAEIWLFLIAFFLLYYAVTDGSDLGVGMLSLVSRDENERAIMVATLAGAWHGNQTWLVMLGGMLFGAFPLFYALVLSALYVPILMMVFGLLLRGVALDYYDDSTHKRAWGLAFGIGSTIATLAQGFALGGLLGGLHVVTGRFIGSVWDWATPFTALATAGVFFGYIMLGANYLIMKTVGDLQERSYRYSLIASVVTAFISVSVYLVLIGRHPYLAHKLSTKPDVYYIIPFPVLALLCFALFFRSLFKRHQLAPLLWNAAVILFSFAGLSFGLYPQMIPNVIASPVMIHEAAASANTLLFMLVVTGALVPLILIYTTYQFWVFRGKVTRGYGEE